MQRPRPAPRLRRPMPDWMRNAPPPVPQVSPAPLADFQPTAPVGTGLYGVDATGQTWQYVPPGVIPLAQSGGPFLPISGGQMQGPLDLIATGGTAVRSVQDRFGAQGNVKDFGAIGDGVTDDGPAIQAALNAGGIASFPAGRFYVATPVIFPQNGNVVLLGAGSAQTTIVSGLANSPGGMFRNYLYATIGPDTPLDTTPARQTDVGFNIQGITFDFSQVFASNLAAFLWAREIHISDVRAISSVPANASGGFKFLGCDNVFISGLSAQNAYNAIDCWQGCTRVYVDNCSFDSITLAPTDDPNGGLLNFNGMATDGHAESSRDLHVTNCSFRLNNTIALFLESLYGGSRCSDMVLENLTITAVSGTNFNMAIAARGWGERVVVRNLTVRALTGAAFRTPFEFGVAGSNAPVLGPAANLLTTTNGSPDVTWQATGGNDLGPGNWVEINNGAGGPVVGNGLSLNGYYQVTAASGTAPGATVTFDAGANATASGLIAGTTQIVGYMGAFTGCSLSGVVVDGLAANPGLFQVMYLSGADHAVDQLTVTQNYQGGGVPYGAVIAIDGSLCFPATAQRACVISDVIAAPGTALAPGWGGNAVVEWNPAGPAPHVSNAAGAADNVIVGALVPVRGAFAELDAYGWFYSLYNANGTVPVSASAGAIGWNASPGQQDVSYFNCASTPGASHIFWQRTGAGAATRLLDIDPNGDVSVYGILNIGSHINNWVSWSAGTVPPTSVQPVGSLYSQIGGAIGATLFVSRGGGVWNAVAGV